MSKYNITPTKTESKPALVPPNPSGLCMCGCGKTTKIATYSHPKNGLFIGEHLRCLQGHKPKTEFQLQCVPPNPSGLCFCGCGETTKIATRSSFTKGQIKGEYLCYVYHHTAKTTVPLEERFWAKVIKAGDDECWLWTGGDSRNYGLLSVSHTSHIRAHRYSYELHNGPVPEGLVVRHSCNNSLCVNPRHLLAGTQLDNMQDMVKSRHTRLILTYEQIRELRELDPHGAKARTEAGKRLGVSYSVVKTILAPRNKDKWLE